MKHHKDEGEPFADTFLYHQLVRSLYYLTITRLLLLLFNKLVNLCSVRLAQLAVVQ